MKKLICFIICFFSFSLLAQAQNHTEDKRGEIINKNVVYLDRVLQILKDKQDSIEMLNQEDINNAEKELDELKDKKTYDMIFLESLRESLKYAEVELEAAKPFYAEEEGGALLILTEEYNERLNDDVIFSPRGRIGGKKYTRKELQKIIRRFFKGYNAKLAIAIFYSESNLDPDIIGDERKTFWHKGQKYGRSIGLAQIRTGGVANGIFWDRAKEWGLSVKEFEKKLTDPIFNLMVARKIFDKRRRRDGNGFLAWGAYTNSSYKKHMGEIAER